MSPRFASPDRLTDSSECPLYNGTNRVNYDFGSPANVPKEPVPCPFRQGQIACKATIEFNPIQAEGMGHIANAQRAGGDITGCPGNSNSGLFARPGDDLMSQIYRMF